MYLKFSSNKGHIGAASSVGVMIFIITCIAALLVIKALSEREYKPSKKAIKVYAKGDIKA
jgi:multisubunit Na+/H+ antiporter MnhG subunit